ncbi:MAG TPA: PAS domain-containing protein, partial [Allocoleopsis sp.]
MPDYHATVLLIDDSIADRMFFRRCLERSQEYSYRILEAPTETAGLQLCQHQPDIILCNWRSDQAGLDFLEQMQQPEQESIPIILLIEQRNDQSVSQVLQSPVKDYLVKTELSADLLCRTVRSVVEQSRLQQQLAAAERRLAQMQLEQHRGSLATYQQLQQALEELKTQKTERLRYQNLCNFSPNGYLVTDTGGKIQTANQAAARLFKQDLTYLLGKSFMSFVPLQERQHFCARLQQLSPGQSQTWELDLEVQQASPVSVAITVALSCDAQGEVTGYHWLLRDNREQKRSEADRRQIELEVLRSHDLREAIFNESADALFLVDTKTLLTTDCNDRAVELFQATAKSDLIGIEGRILQRQAFTDEEIEQITAQINTQGFWSCELEYTTLQGQSFWGNLAVNQITVAGQTQN